MHLFCKKEKKQKPGRIRAETEVGSIQRMSGKGAEGMRVVGNDIPAFFQYSFDSGNVNVFYT